MLNIRRETLQDLLINHIDKSTWMRKIPELYPQDEGRIVVFDHPVVSKFKHFTIYPAGIYFYIEDNEVKRNSYVVKTKEFAGFEDYTEDDEYNRLILLSIFDLEDGKRVIRYAQVFDDILV